MCRIINLKIDDEIFLIVTMNDFFDLQQLLKVLLS